MGWLMIFWIGELFPTLLTELMLVLGSRNIAGDSIARIRPHRS
jgi:hypothetical protein